jgi:diadenosine tetraphosphate (Ap4A) HIT family hydrolase
MRSDAAIYEGVHVDMKVVSIRTRLTTDTPCRTCGFHLWEPIAESPHAKLGLYSDSRFPGRSILTLRGHFESLDSVPMDTMMGFLRDIQICMLAIQSATGAHRVNVAILGNRETHVHAHLIPRFPEQEKFPDRSPWNDEREKEPLPTEQLNAIKQNIFEQLSKYDRRRAASDDPSLFEMREGSGQS